MRARDVMTREVLAVKPETSVYDVARLLVEQRISGVPVVDEELKLVGILTEGDLFRRREIGTEKIRSWWSEMVASTATLASEYAQSSAWMVGDLMSREVIAVGPDTPLREIAEIFESRSINRVPVVKDRKLVGIVSRANLVELLGSAKTLHLDAS